MSNLTIPPADWLAELFEFEYCAECGGDAEHHTAIPFLGNWFARCDYPPNDTADHLPGDDGGPLHECERFHPTIRAFHRAKTENRT
jgi:hypothetical protein